MVARNKTAGVRAPRLRDLPPADYANFVAINHTPYELTMFFGQVSNPGHALDLEDLGEPPVIEAKPVARVSIPAAIVDRTLEALTKQAEKMKEELGESENKESESR